MEDQQEIDDKFHKKMLEKYPLLFISPEHRFEEQLEPEICFECNSGWYGILETMFSCIYERYESHKDYYRIMNKAMQEGDKSVTKEKLDQINDALEDIINGLPQFGQIKEKFGTLRISAYSNTDFDHIAIRMAEKLSETVCEECGYPGSLKTKNGWLMTLCDTHAKKHGAKNAR